MTYQKELEELVMKGVRIDGTQLAGMLYGCQYSHNENSEVIDMC